MNRSENNYTERYINKNLKQLYKNIIIIKRTEPENKLEKIINETIEFCNVLECSLNKGIDVSENIDLEKVELINELIVICKCYRCAQDLLENADIDIKEEYKIRINMLINERIKKIKMFIL